MKHVQ